MQPAYQLIKSCLHLQILNPHFSDVDELIPPVIETTSSRPFAAAANEIWATWPRAVEEMGVFQREEANNSLIHADPHSHLNGMFGGSPSPHPFERVFPYQGELPIRDEI